MYKNVYPTLGEAWVSLTRDIMLTGKMNMTEYGTRTLFINGVAFEITAIDGKWDRRDPILSKNYLAAYLEQFKRGYSHGFAYTYIDRLTKVSDQLGFIREQLLKGRKETKRLNAITWDVTKDMDENNKNPPCLQSVWVYPYTDNQLDIHIRFRSWDIYKAFQADILGLSFMFNKELLEPTGYKLKTLRCYGDNCHIYAEDWEDAERI